MASRATAFGLSLALALATSAAHAAPSSNVTGSGSTLAVDKYPAPCPTVSREKADAAHATYVVGKQAYDVYDHAEAIRRFVSAYELDCTKHELLVVISRSFESLGNRAEAARALEEFLARAQLGDKERETVKARLANMKKGLAENPAKPQPTPPPTPTPSPTPTPAPAPSQPPPARTEVREHTVYPWVVAGVGGLALVTGLTVYVVGLQTAPDNCIASERKCTRQPGETDTAFASRQEKAGTAAGLQTGGLVALVGGGVLAVGGLVWHFVEPTGPKSSEAKTPRLVPAVSPGYAGVELGGRF